MFNKNDIEKYQSIAPSEDLKKRVMATYEQEKGTKKHNTTLYKQISLIAACFVLVFVSAVFVRTETAEIKLYANGEIVSEDSVELDKYGVGLASKRSVSDEIIINLETTAFLKSQIKVSQGELWVFDKKTGEVLSSGETCSVKGQVSIQWVVEKEKVNKAEISITNAIKENVFEIEYNDKTEQKIIKKK